MANPTPGRLPDFLRKNRQRAVQQGDAAAVAEFDRLLRMAASAVRMRGCSADGDGHCERSGHEQEALGVEGGFRA